MRKNSFLIFALVAVTATVAWLSPLPALAADLWLEGHAWSSNIGWIKFDGSNPDYGVYLNEVGATGVYNFGGDGGGSGYAWTSTLGWIKFDSSLTGPQGQGNEHGARLNANNTVTGWARACTVFADGCSGLLLPDQQLGGWDGWISMSGSSPDYGVSRVGAGIPEEDHLEGFAWGSTVIGWVSFCDTVGDLYCVNVLGQPPATASVTLLGEEPPGSGNYGENLSIATSTPFSLHWSNAGIEADSCIATVVPVPTGDNWTSSGAVFNNPGNREINGIPDIGVYTYRLECDAEEGNQPENPFDEVVINVTNLSGEPELQIDGTDLVVISQQNPGSYAFSTTAKVRNIGGGSITIKVEDIINPPPHSPALPNPPNNGRDGSLITVDGGILDGTGSQILPNCRLINSDFNPNQFDTKCGEVEFTLIGGDPNRDTAQFNIKIWRPLGRLDAYSPYDVTIGDPNSSNPNHHVNLRFLYQVGYLGEY